MASVGVVLSAVGLVGVIMVGMVVSGGRWALGAGVVWATVSLGVILPEAVKTRDGQGHWSKWVGVLVFRRRERGGYTVLSQGVAGVVPGRAARLPGVAARLKLSEHTDIHGNRFGLLDWRNDLYAVVLNAYPAGPSGKDPGVFDAEVAQWAAWLGNLNRSGQVVAAQVSVETVPDPGLRLGRAIDRGRAPDGVVVPEFSARLAEEIKRAAAEGGTPAIVTRITVTFTGVEVSDETGKTVTRTAREMAGLIGDLLPELASALGGTGAGQSVRAATAQQITDFCRVAYDPAAAELVEAAQMTPEGTGLTWDQVGPLTAVNHFDAYQHESGWSRTWQMREPPKGAVFATVLRQLLAPHPDVPRKRVTLCFQPESAVTSARIAERDVTSARLAVSGSPRPTAAQVETLEAAQRTAMQEATGAALVRVGLVVTATVVDDPARLERVATIIEGRLAPGSRLRFRVPRGAQDTAFAAALPLGMVPARHAGLASLTEHI